MSDLRLGKLEKIHGISPAFVQRGVVVAVLSFLFFLLTLIGVYVRKNIGYFLLSTAFLIVYVLTMFGWMMARRNTFTVYENGFTFRKRTFLWDEIETIEGKMESRVFGAAKMNFEVTKTDGEKIVLTEAIDGADKIIERISGEIEKRSGREQIL